MLQASYPKIVKRSISIVLLCGIFLLFATSFYNFFPKFPNSKTSYATIGNVSQEDSISSQAVEVPENAQQRIAELIKLSATQPDNFEILLDLATECMNLNDGAAASLFARKAVDLAPNDVAARMVLANAYFLNKEVDKALSTFESIASIKVHPPALLNLAYIYREHLAKPEEAKRILEEVLLIEDLAPEFRERAQEDLLLITP